MVPLWFAPPPHAQMSHIDMRMPGRPHMSMPPAPAQARAPLGGNRAPNPHSAFPGNGPPGVQGRHFLGMPHHARSMAPAPGHGHAPPHQRVSSMPQQMQMYNNKQRFPPPPGMHFPPPDGPPHPSNMIRRPNFPPMHRPMHQHSQGMHPQMRHPGAHLPSHPGRMHGPPTSMPGTHSGPPGLHQANQETQRKSSPTMPRAPIPSRPNGSSLTIPIDTQSGPGPLRESRAHNMQDQPSITKPQNSDMTSKPSHADIAPSQQAEATLDAASILLGLRTTGSPTNSFEVEKRDDSPKREIEMIREGVFPTRLALPDDENKLNSMHCFLRSELLELFVVEAKTGSKEEQQPKIKDYVVGSSCGRVGLRCIHCAQARKLHGSDGEAPMAVFYPKSISELYRLVTSWQRVHLRKCRNLPPSVHEMYSELKKNDKTRGKTQYWVTSARELGLVDCSSKAGGIRFTAE